MTTPTFACLTGDTSHAPGTVHHIYAHGRSPLGSTHGGPASWADTRLPILLDLRIRCCCGSWEHASTDALHAQLNDVHQSWQAHATPAPIDTQHGWTPAPGDLVTVWVTPPDWGGIPADLTVQWTNPARFLGEDTDSSGTPRWIVGPNRANASYLPKARTNLAPAVRPAASGVTEPPLFDDLLQLAAYLEAVPA